jgi:ribosomal protein S27E
MNEIGNKRFRRSIIPVWCHTAGWIVISLGSAYIGLIFGKYMGSYFGLTGDIHELFGGVCMLAAFIFPSSWFRNRIPARCSKCGGKTWCRFDRSFFIYTCESCGYIVNTKMGPGET